jgi:glycosyltransferase involved in cell wall biosynthesis
LAATSRWIAGEAARSSLLRGVPATVIPNGLDTDSFRPLDRDASRAMLGIPPKVPVVLFASHTLTNPLKGLAYLHSAMEAIDAPERPLLVTVGRRSWDVPQPVATRHLGPLCDDISLAAAYSAADVFAMPSLMEPFGQTTIEALACGTPVVAFDACGPADTVVAGETGYSIPRGDVAAFSAAILRVLRQSPEQRARMAANCRETALREYSVGVQAARYLALYESLVAQVAGGMGRRGV